MARAILAIALVAVIGQGALAAQLSQGADLAAAGWSVDRSASPAHRLSPTIAVKRVQQVALHDLVMDVSNPQSPNYGKYPTMEEVVKMTHPEEASMNKVTEWLNSEFVSYTVDKHVITLDVSVAQASSLFGTQFSHVSNAKTNQKTIVGTAVNVPDEVAEHVEAVFGIHGLPLPPRNNKPTAGTPVDVTPDIIHKTYNVSGYTASGSTKVRQACAEFQGQLCSQQDLTTFFNKYVPTAKSGDDKIFKYVGDSQQGEGVEANLDVQYIMGTAPGVKTEMWQYAGQDFCTDLKQWTQQIISTSDAPLVFSVSYGWQGDMSQIGCSTSQISSIDADFKTITATGISIIFASGDSGSGYSSFFGSNAKLYASWPASSMYVTAVGATRFINQQPGDGEQATDQFGSGGGFSRIVTPAPAWQSSAISSFNSKETQLPPASTYNKAGRGTPDVAALGEGFQVIMNGNPESVGGTSAAAPTFSGIVSLLNDARVAAGKKPLGLLNQWIYQNPGIFSDVTVGNDRISRSGSTVPDGFDCEEGWDPVTGWGTPLFHKMMKSAMNQ